MNKKIKSVLACSLVSVTSIVAIGTPIISYANTPSIKNDSTYFENEVKETQVTQEEYDNFGSDSDYKLDISDEVLTKMRNGETIEIENVNDPSMYASVRYNWKVGNSSWSITYNGLNSKVYEKHVLVTNKFKRNGGSYTGTLHDLKHYGFTSSVSAEGKVGNIAKTIQKGDTIYLKIVQSGKTLYNSGFGN